MKAQIDTVDASGTYWYVVFNDSDSQTDYFHSYRGSQKRIAELLNEHGAKKVTVRAQNGRDGLSLAQKKAVNRLAELTGYNVELFKEKRGQLSEETWDYFHYILTKKEVSR